MADREKVIKGLETHIKPNSRCVGCPYPNNGLCGDQLYHDALALLKEQEPKPVKIVRNAYNHPFYHCPNCGRGFLEPYKRPKFCDKCGQAITWDI